MSDMHIRNALDTVISWNDDTAFSCVASLANRFLD